MDELRLLLQVRLMTSQTDAPPRARANPEIVILLSKDRYSGLYRQWKRSIGALPTRTLVRLRLLLLLRAGMLSREHLGVPESATGKPDGVRIRTSRRGRKKPRNAESYYAIRCRIDTRLYPDILDEWRALSRGSRSEMFAQYLRIGLQMKPEELRALVQRVTRNIAWIPSTALPELIERRSPQAETRSLSGSGQSDDVGARMTEDFLFPKD